MKRKNITNGVIWITGFSSSGKTTISRKVERRLKKQNINTIILDGDELRNIFGEQWGYDEKSRQNLARVYMRLCSHLSSQGYVVIIAAIAMFDETGDWLRANIQNAMQVYLDVPHGEREERDHQTKKIFGNSNFSESIYDIPQKPELTIKNYGDISTDKAAEMVVERFYEIIGHSKDRGRKAHWDLYYQKSNAPIQPSTYAESVLPFMKPGETMLEIGSGNGRDASYFAKNGMQVVAIDRSETAVKLCKDQHQNLPIEFYTGTLTDVSSKFSKKKFDAVFTRFVLHAMPLDEEIETLAICSRLMRIGGKLFIECRSINDPLSRKGEILSPTERINGHYRRFIILEELIERLTNAGFKIQSAKESQGLSAFGDDDPVVIRITAEKLIGIEH